MLTASPFPLVLALGGFDGERMDSLREGGLRPYCSGCFPMSMLMPLPLAPPELLVLVFDC